MSLEKLVFRNDSDGKLISGVLTKFAQTTAGSNSPESTCIRELLQNSIDAGRKEIENGKINTIRFTISRQYADIGEFTDLNSLKSIYATALENIDPRGKDYRWVNKHNNKLKEKVNGKKSRVLIISDNCGGIDGESRDIDKGEKGTYKILDQGSTTKYDSDQNGSHGIGKETAYFISDIYTVFYLNRAGNSSLLIGKTQVPEHKLRETDKKKIGSDVFAGKLKPGKTQESDWMRVNENDYREIFSLPQNEKGLSTIIPISKKPIKAGAERERDNEWSKRICFYVISSYFPILKEGKLEVIIEDTDITDATEKIILNEENYREHYEGLKSCKEFKEHKDTINAKTIREEAIDYYNKKPIILEKNRIIEPDGHSFNLPMEFEGDKKTYKGTATISYFINSDFERFVKNSDKYIIKSKHKRLFFLKSGDLIFRNLFLPNVAPASLKYCGLVEFKGDQGKEMNQVLKDIELQTHDNIDFELIEEKDQKLSKSLAGKSRTAGFLQSLSKSIKQSIDILAGNTININESIDITLDQSFNDGKNYGETPSWQRRASNPKEKAKKSKEYNNPTATSELDSGNEELLILSDGTEDPLGDDQAGRHTKGTPGENGGSSGGSGEPDIREGGPRVNDNPGGMKKIKKGTVRSIPAQTKITSAKGNIKIYQNRLKVKSNEPINIVIQPLGSEKNTVFSSRLLEIRVNKKICNLNPNEGDLGYSYETDKQTKLIKNYQVHNASVIENKIEIEMKLMESALTISDFKFTVK